MIRDKARNQIYPIKVTLKIECEADDQDVLDLMVKGIANEAIKFGATSVDMVRVFPIAEKEVEYPKC